MALVERFVEYYNNLEQEELFSSLAWNDSLVI